MLSFSPAELVQLTIGAIIGTAVSINLSRYGLSITDPKTCWKAGAVILAFLFVFLMLTDLLLA